MKTAKTLGVDKQKTIGYEYGRVIQSDRDLATHDLKSLRESQVSKRGSHMSEQSTPNGTTHFQPTPMSNNGRVSFKTLSTID